MEKLDYKKEYKDLYLPGTAPVCIEVPPICFIMVDGQGDPNGEEYQAAMQLLYALSFTLKMGAKQADGYFEYVVPPLEGLWAGKGEVFDITRRGDWRWTSMIRQPGFVTPELFAWAQEECRRKKGLDTTHARLQTYAEGLCVQMMHIGPYAGEPETLAQMEAYMQQNGLVNETGALRRHHEIYLSDPRKTAPEKLKTVLRLPVARG